MRRHRTRGRGILFPLLAGLLAGVFLVPASGAESTGSSVPRLVFRLVAKTDLWDNYGDSRGAHRHAGIDMENPWRAPVVAVEPGRVSYAESGLGGCMLYLYGRSGTMYLYIHLNNDLTARNDNRGGCVKDVTFAVPNGARVAAGEQVAWNGDSGDANGRPHLHFDVHPNGGVDVNPFRHLARAQRPLFSAKLGSQFSLGLRGKLVGAGGGTVQVDVERVRHYPGGRWLEIDERPLELTVPPDAVVAPALAGKLTVGVHRSIAAATPLTVHTTAGRTTTEAMVGEAGVLAVSRIVADG